MLVHISLSPIQNCNLMLTLPLGDKLAGKENEPFSAESLLSVTFRSNQSKQKNVPPPTVSQLHLSTQCLYLKIYILNDYH